MAFFPSFRGTHLLKRGRDGQCGPLDGEFGNDWYKRRCSKNRGVKLFGLEDQELEQEDMVFPYQHGQVYGLLREETADSETSSSKVYYDSENFSPPFCRSSSFTSVPRFPVPDDAQSSTSDSCCYCCDTSDDEEEDDDEEGNESSSSSSSSSLSESTTQSFISYLFEASDDDLGLPPPVCTAYDASTKDGHQNQNQSNVSDRHVETLDLDLDLDLGLDLDWDLDVTSDQLLEWGMISYLQVLLRKCFMES